MANRDSENSVLTREQVLALDIATHTGYFSLHEAGTWNFTESKRRTGQRFTIRVPNTTTAGCNRKNTQKCLSFLRNR